MPRILIVDDSASVRQLLGMSLKRIRGGADLVEAVHGIDGLKKLKESLSGKPFDLIFTDINMPLMDGLKFLSMVRQEETYKETPVVIVTTEGASGDIDRGLALGANNYITKPAKPSDILNTAEALLGITR